MMKSVQKTLYLTDADISSLDIDVHSVRSAICEVFRSYGSGEVQSAPKTSISIGPGHAFQSLVAVDAQHEYAAVKWVGQVPPGPAGYININASILLSNTRTGHICCLMDARRATALRTAGMTAVAAQYLARKESAEIGFVGAGTQAESHLVALAELLPSLRTVYVNSRTSPTGLRFAERCRELGFDATLKTPQQVVELSDVLITTVPLGPYFEPFLDPAWIPPGAFVAAIDLGRSWKHDGLTAMDLTVVDEDAMKHYATPGNFIPPLEYAAATLNDLVSGQHAGRVGNDQRIMLFSSGSAVADIAIATLIYERALTKKVGTQLAS